jgi:hypothetical protein
MNVTEQIVLSQNVIDAINDKLQSRILFKNAGKINFKYDRVAIKRNGLYKTVSREFTIRVFSQFPLENYGRPGFLILDTSSVRFLSRSALQSLLCFDCFDRRSENQDREVWTLCCFLGRNLAWGSLQGHQEWNLDELSDLVGSTNETSN